MDISTYESLNNAPQVDEGLIDEVTNMDISPYEPLDSSPQGYEELNDDFRKQTIPVSVGQTGAIQLQPISDSTYEQIKTHTFDPCSSECRKTNQVIIGNDQSKDTTQCISSSSSNVNGVTLNVVTNPPILHVYLDLLNETASIHGNEYDVINTYDYIHIGNEPLTTDEEQQSTHSPINRPLPVLPLSIYEPLNTNAGTFNDRKIVPRRACICITKIILILAALVGVFVTGGFIAIKLLPINVDDQKGKLFVRSIFV